MIIGYGRQNINNQDLNSVKKVLKSKNLTQGPAVEAFEVALKKYFSSKHAITVSNGSAALHLIGKTLGWKKNDIIIVPPITFVSSVNSILHCGATPMFIDINMDDYSIDLLKLEKALKQNKNKKIKAVIVTDYAGHPSDWKKLYKLKKKYKIVLINDNCHAIGASIDRNKGYASKYADFVSLSFHPVKTITTGEGGAVLTNNKDYAKKIQLLRSHGIERNKKLSNKYGYWYYEMIVLGFNYRLTDIQAALGTSQIRRVDKFIKKRNYIANFYNKIFIDKNKFTTPNVRKNFKHAYHLYPLLINTKNIGVTKINIFKKFLKEKIRLQVHYIPVNSQPYYVKKFGLNKKKFINSFLFYRKEISLPIYYDLSIKQLEYIKKVCGKIFKI
jgi:UDP-4-amino-4,6-dideoxy-N-acetyl-beta-L-altrosamine transaminase